MILLTVMPAQAADGDDGDHSAESEAQDETHEQEHGREHLNEVAIFLGATDEHGHDTEFTWGLDYKRHVSERWALGVIFDYAGGELRNTLLAPTVFFWPGLGNLELLAAAGVEVHSGRGLVLGSRKSSAEASVDKDATYFLVRIGVAYGIHLGNRFALAPLISLDFVNNEKVWVYGLAVTYGF